VGVAKTNELSERTAELHFIRSDKPTQNCYVESFDGRFRDECRNENWFVCLGDARQRLETWLVGWGDGAIRAARDADVSISPPEIP